MAVLLLTDSHRKNHQISPFFFFLSLFREKASMSGGGAEREGEERESQAGSAPPAQRPTQGSNPQNHEIMT